MQNKHTEGEWEPIFVSGCCIGVGVEKGNGMREIICNTILPDTDKEYKAQKENIEANAKLIAAAPDLLFALQAMDTLDKIKHLSGKWWKQAEVCNELRKKAIKKATS